MQVRPFTGADLLAGEMAQSISFLGSMDVEARRREIEAGKVSPNNRWGCFTAAGELAAAMIDNPYRMYYHGDVVRMNGVGAVCSLPEYRRGGAVRAIFAPMLRHARAQGVVFSMLYPFSHEFYRKFGYELCQSTSLRTLPTELLAGFRHTGWAKRVDKDEHAAQITLLHNIFSARYNGAIERDEAMTRRVTHGDPFKDQSFTYLLGEGEGAQAYAYVHYRLAREGDRRTLRVVHFAFSARAGWRAILGFLARMSADFSHVAFELPADLPLALLLPRPYDVEHKALHSLMARVLDPLAALARLPRPEGTDFTLRLRDDFLPENGGVYRVCAAGVRQLAADGAADLSLSAQALAPLCLGALSLDEALYRDDVALHANEEALRATFARHIIYQTDRY